MYPARLEYFGITQYYNFQPVFIWLRKDLLSKTWLSSKSFKHLEHCYKFWVMEAIMIFSNKTVKNQLYIILIISSLKNYSNIFSAPDRFIVANEESDKQIFIHLVLIVISCGWSQSSRRVILSFLKNNNVLLIIIFFYHVAIFRNILHRVTIVVLLFYMIHLLVIGLIYFYVYRTLLLVSLQRSKFLTFLAVDHAFFRNTTWLKNNDLFIFITYKNKNLPHNQIPR